ncbi:J domain-containing protein [Levilinea saccharolytica]|uniref:J domain-containing protein n=1 Tax=Levilinea saccharolytica TaxID=229921 RepID=UPI0009466F52|nr:J domain-containing protein [Levilinea saccharolytica]GAP16337.1 DnaJ-class molecular chaperone with C-terminal Zn finger domain [Levilinea saccharolytica]
MKNYYTIFEIDPTATNEQIRSQYRFLLHAWHPDKFPEGELRTKAEEKTKEVIEAYSVLANPDKRQEYDEYLRLYSNLRNGATTSRSSSSQSTSTQSTTSQSPSSQPSKSQSEPKQSASSPPEQNQAKAGKKYCECCKMPAETQHINFHENIGMVIFRRYRSIEGNFCKPCIDYYFWSSTGRTMLLGWWGLISFIVTPFILLNNMIRFLFTLGMKRPAVSITPSPPPFWIFSTISGSLLIGCLLYSFFSPAAINTPATDNHALGGVVYQIATPTKTSTQVRTPTPAPTCLKWSKISPSMIGSYSCVYGIIYETRSDSNSFWILFSPMPSEVFLVSDKFTYEVASGDCVAAEGRIMEASNGAPYININEALYNCEPWMK